MSGSAGSKWLRWFIFSSFYSIDNLPMPGNSYYSVILTITAYRAFLHNGPHPLLPFHRFAPYILGFRAITDGKFWNSNARRRVLEYILAELNARYYLSWKFNKDKVLVFVTLCENFQKMQVNPNPNHNA